MFIFGYIYYILCIFIRFVKLNWIFFILDLIDDDKIMVEGIGRFCEDFKLDFVNLRVFLIVWKFKVVI